MILIDVPVTPFSRPAQIKAWIRRLEKMRTKVKMEDRLHVDKKISQAHDWLRAQRTPPQRAS